MQDRLSQGEVGSRITPELKEGGESDAAYNPRKMGASFANEFDQLDLGDEEEPAPAEGSAGLNPSVLDGNKKIIDRFGDNPVGNLLKVGAGNGSDATEKGLVTGAPKSSNVQGVYTPSRFVPNARKGKKIVDADTGLFPFNYIAGRRSESVLSVGKDDRMLPVEAKEKLHGVLAMFGIENESHEYLYTFTHALLVAHALNGASIAGPGRATFSVDNDMFPYGDVVKFLGPDARRFYRAFADETAKALLSVLDRYDPGNSTTVMLCGQIRFIAVSKKLTQYPYLIHDSADACYRTSVTEMAAVVKSKQFVLNSGSASNTIEGLEKTVEG